MKIGKKSILSAGLAVALAAATVVGGTYAYLHDSTGDVVNNFKTYNIDVELTETAADYNIIPGTSQKKDPTVTLSSQVPAYTFVEVKDDTDGLVTYSVADGWGALEGFPGVYYRAVDASDAEQSFEVLKDSTVYYDKSLENSDMLENGVLKENVNLTFKAHAIQQEGFDGAADAYVEAVAVKVNSKDDLKAAISKAEDGTVIALPETPIVLDKEESLSIKADTTVVGGTITNGTLHVNKESDVIFNGVTFTDPTNKSSNATSVYASGFDSKIVFEGCTFKDLQWEAIQITPLAGAEIVVNNCYFSNSKTMAESGVQQNRYVQIEVTDTSTDISKIKATITNNIFENVVQSAFGGNGYFKDSAVTVYGVPHSNITLGGNVFCGVVAADALNNPNYLWISDGRSYKLRYDGFAVAENVASSEDLSKALEEGKPVYMTGNITLPEQLETAGDITVIGNGNELASPAGATRIVNVTGEVCDNVTLNFKDVKLVGPTSGTYTRGISIYDSENVTVNIEDCELSANYYAFNIASASNNTVLNIKDSVVTGWAAFQTHSPYSKVTFENCTLIGLNDKGYNAEGWNDFATIVINGFTEGNPDLQGAHDGEFVFKNCRIEANQTTGNNQYFLSVRAANTTVMVENCTFFKDGVQIPTSELNNAKYISVYPEVYDTFKYIIK